MSLLKGTYDPETRGATANDDEVAVDAIEFPPNRGVVAVNAEALEDKRVAAIKNLILIFF